MIAVKDLYHESVDLRILEAKQQTGKQPYIIGSYVTIDNFLVRQAYYRNVFPNFIGYTLKDMLNAKQKYKECEIRLNNNIPFGTIMIGVD